MFAKRRNEEGGPLCERVETLSLFVGLLCGLAEPLCSWDGTPCLFGKRLYEEGEPLCARGETL
jgi:hypothetical protein